MKVLAAVLIALLAIPTYASDWSSSIRKAQSSLVALSYQGHNFCSGFVINADEDFIVTADHCVRAMKGEAFEVDRRPSVVIYRDTVEDIAVVYSVSAKPSIKVSTKTLELGLPVVALGYAYGFDLPQARIGSLVYAGVGVVDWCDSGECYGMAPSHIGGMSGGPVVDADGKLIGIVQFGDSQTGFGRNLKTILKSVGSYFK